MADEELEALKRQLGGLAGAEETDYNAILKLAGRIARQEPGVVRFTTDAAMVRRLGRELVAKQETALGELVKNAYDADATSCTVNLVEADFAPALEIIDDGTGMAYDDIVNGFMRLASDAKVVEPRSPRYGRARAGKKGIGRFATERLGRQLTIVTQTEAEANGWTLDIDWNAFAQGEDLASVGNRVRSSPKERPHGTRLYISDLHDRWQDADLRRVYRYLSTLLQPRAVELAPEEARDTTAAQDPGFAMSISRDNDFLDEPHTVANADTEVLSLALAVIEAAVDDSGRATWSMSCPRFEVEVEDEPIGIDRVRAEPLANARSVEMRAYYFIRAREFLGHSTSYIGDMLNEHGGVRLYRNGYRVPPYGEKNDDWLGLDAKRTQTYAPISSKTFLGFVGLTDPSGRLFEETSSREGLLITPAFEEVRDVMSRVLEAAVRRIESVRGLGRRTRDRHDPRGGARAAAVVEAAVADVENALEDLGGLGGDGAIGAADAALERLRTAVQLTSDVARERDDLLEELSLLRILASMGLTIAEFTHDFEHLAETLELNLSAISAVVGSDDGRLTGRLDRLRGQFRQVRAYTAHFGSMMTSNASRDLQAVDLYAFVRNFSDDVGAMFTRRGLVMEIEPPLQYDLRTVPMHSSEWSSILLNLLTNAIKAAQRAQRAGRFFIKLGRLENQHVFLDFCDNGDGIAPENRARVFDAFFTTSSGSAVRATETAQALGTGLGLKIVADVVQAVGGRVEVIDPPEGYATCIRVSVPPAPPELDEDDA